LRIAALDLGYELVHGRDVARPAEGQDVRPDHLRARTEGEDQRVIFEVTPTPEKDAAELRRHMVQAVHEQIDCEVVGDSCNRMALSRLHAERLAHRLGPVYEVGLRLDERDPDTRPSHGTERDQRFETGNAAPDDHDVERLDGR
jgi:hypothetical protein